MTAYLTPILETGRLKLRPLTYDDAEAQYAIFSDPEVVRYWSSEVWTDMASAHEWIAHALECYRTASSLRFAVEIAATGEMVGNVNLYDFSERNRRCEIGYAFGSAHWGQGYALEALEAALDYGFRMLDLNRVEADVDPGNPASSRLLEKLGFRKEGYMPERWIVHGAMADAVYYGLLKRYWDERRSSIETKQ